MTAEEALAATIVDVQRFSLHDGPGIRTTVFFKGCPLRCAWCQNPEALRRQPEMAFYADRCQSSHACTAACDEEAIVEGPDRRIDADRCTACGACADACIHQALRLIGRRVEVDELVDELLKDADFYADSDGGITLSGGEPMVHATYLEHVLPRLKAHGLHVAMQTCGMFSWSRMPDLLPHLDLVLFDLKHQDSNRHRELTGVGNETILDNFGRLTAADVELQPRMPVIPSHNDDDTNVVATARFLQRHGHRTLHLLAYHHLGEAMLPRLSSTIEPLGLESLDPAGLAPIVYRFEQEGIHALVSD